MLYYPLLLTLCIVGVVNSNRCFAQIPPHFEIVDVLLDTTTKTPQAMNDCGEFVYSYWGPDAKPYSEVYRYDNGLIETLTNFVDIPAGPLDINSHGRIVYVVQPGNTQTAQLYRMDEFGLTYIDYGSQAVMNDNGFVVYSQAEAPTTCELTRRIFAYDNGEIIPISTTTLSNQGPSVNVWGDITYTRYTFCGSGLFDWTSEIMLATSTTEQPITDAVNQPQVSFINDSGQIVWTHNGMQKIGIMRYDAGETEVLVPAVNGNSVIVSEMNNLGTIYYVEWDPVREKWEARIRYDHGDTSSTIKINNGLFWASSHAALNDYNEIVLVSYSDPLGPVPFQYGKLRYMRRIRTGDMPDGDKQFDLAIDLEDFAKLQNCFTGSVDTPRLCDCRFVDIDHDRDVDLADFSLFDLNMTGP